MKVELRYWEIFDHVTKTFLTVEAALLFYRRYKDNNKRKVHWFGGEYRFKLKDGEWSEWCRI